MRIAILSDIHGNPIALEAVLADIQKQGPIDEYWLLGDFAAIGYDPVKVLERVSALPNARFARGNTDRYLITDELPLSLQQMQTQVRPELLPKMISTVKSFAWTRGYLAASGWLDWLARLPLEQRLRLPDGTRLLGVHAAPGTDDGPGIHLRLSEAELEALVKDCNADLICVGHTHIPLDRTAGGVRVINLGSVSNPVTPELLASYAIVKANNSGYQVQLRRVPYDREAVIEAVKRSGHPAGDYIIQFMRGEFVATSAL
jgi:predicted phosphodiesterase